MPDSILTVIKNPTPPQIANLLARSDEDSLRGIVDDGGNLYAWDAAQATHDDINRHLGLGIKYRLALYTGLVTTDEKNMVAQLPTAPALQRAYGISFKVRYEE